MLTIAILIMHVLACLFLVAFVLLHSGKGGGLSDMFGGGGGLAGGTSVEKTLDRITIVTAFVFALTTVYLVKFWT